MEFGWPNIEIGWKMANGHLLIFMRARREYVPRRGVVTFLCCQLVKYYIPTLASVCPIDFLFLDNSVVL